MMRLGTVRQQSPFHPVGLVILLALGLSATGCLPASEGGASRRRAQPVVVRRTPNPPLKPPKQKLWSCKQPKPRKALAPGKPGAALFHRLTKAGRLPMKMAPIGRWKPAILDFTIQDHKYLFWYRITRGKIRLVERIPLKRFGGVVKGHYWLNPRELVLHTGVDRFVRMIFRSSPSAGPLPKPGHRYRLQKVGTLPRWLRPRAKLTRDIKIIVTHAGELWQGYCWEEHGNHEMPYCKTWAYGRVLPSFAKSRTAPQQRSPAWKMKPPAGYLIQIQDDCLTCYKGRQAWVMYPGGWFHTHVQHAQVRRWIGHRVPLWMASMDYTEPGENGWAKGPSSVNLYEACRGWPVGFHVQLYWGPRPYVAYYKNAHHGSSEQMHFRYDGQHFTTLAVPSSAPLSFRPLDIKKKRRRP